MVEARIETRGRGRDLLLAVCAAAPPVKAGPPVMPVTKLKKAILVPQQCVLHYRVTTSSEQCQAYVDQANCDYRDPLFWAEYPNIAGTGTKAEMARRYRALGFKTPKVLKVKSRRARARSAAKSR